MCKAQSVDRGIADVPADCMHASQLTSHLASYATLSLSRGIPAAILSQLASRQLPLPQAKCMRHDEYRARHASTPCTICHCIRNCAALTPPCAHAMYPCTHAMPPCAHAMQSYFTYITQYSHPSAEGLAFLSDLPKALFEELTGEFEFESD